MLSGISVLCSIVFLLPLYTVIKWLSKQNVNSGIKKLTLSIIHIIAVFILLVFIEMVIFQSSKLFGLYPIDMVLIAPYIISGLFGIWILKFPKYREVEL